VSNPWLTGGVVPIISPIPLTDAGSGLPEGAPPFRPQGAAPRSHAVRSTPLPATGAGAPLSEAVESVLVSEGEWEDPGPRRCLPLRDIARPNGLTVCQAKLISLFTIAHPYFPKSLSCSRVLPKPQQSINCHCITLSSLFAGLILFGFFYPFPRPHSHDARFIPSLKSALAPDLHPMSG